MWVCEWCVCFVISPNPPAARRKKKIGERIRMTWDPVQLENTLTPFFCFVPPAIAQRVCVISWVVRLRVRNNGRASFCTAEKVCLPLIEKISNRTRKEQGKKKGLWWELVIGGAVKLIGRSVRHHLVGSENKVAIGVGQQQRPTNSSSWRNQVPQWAAFRVNQTAKRPRTKELPASRTTTTDKVERRPSSSTPACRSTPGRSIPCWPLGRASAGHSSRPESTCSSSELHSLPYIQYLYNRYT